jgi:hypothetical protein
MSGSIRKYPAMVAFPKTKYDNMLYFDVASENNQVIDMAASYLELEMALYDGNGAAVTDWSNICLGHDGLQYNASALFRSAKLSESRTGKVMQDLVYVNMLSNNLEYWTKGANRVISDSLFSGQSSVGQNNSLLSVFNNDYSDPSPVIRTPLSLLYPGQIGDSDILPQEKDFEFRYLLEPQYNVFQRAVPNNVYGVGEVVILDAQVFGDVLATETVATPAALGVVTLANFPVANTSCLVECIIDGAATTFSRDILVTYDAGAVVGFVNFQSELSALNNATAVTISPISNSNKLACGDTLPNATTLSFFPSTTGNEVGGDIQIGTQINVIYSVVDPANGLLAPSVLSTTITNVAIAAGKYTVITIANAMPNTYTSGVYVVPVVTNLDSYNWAVTNAHLVLYRRMMSVKAPEKMLVSNFESINVGMVGGLNRFMYNFKAHANTYNLYVMTPNQTNLYSQLEGLETYLVSVDDKPLTTIYLNAVNSALHLDNMYRTLSNSEVYKPVNLSLYRDQYLESNIQPTIFPAKLVASSVKGETNIQNFDLPDKNVKVELVAANGTSTPTKNVYMFLEKFDQV